MRAVLDVLKRVFVFLFKFAIFLLAMGLFAIILVQIMDSYGILIGCAVWIGTLILSLLAVLVILVLSAVMTYFVQKHTFKGFITSIRED